MAKQTTYKQARLRRTTETGTIETTSWIPAKHAKVGRVVSLKDENGEWSPDYTVVGVGQATVNEAPDWRKMIRGHRKHTGDSIPRPAG